MLTKFRAKMIAKLYAPHMRAGLRVLDVGCGNAVVSKYLIDKFGITLEGTDILEYLEEQICFKKMDKPNVLPYADGSFDTVMFNDVLHHTENIEALLREALRVASKILIFEMGPSGWARFVDRFANVFIHKDMPVPLNFLNKQEWVEVLAELNCKFQVEEMRRPFFGYPIKHYFICVERKV